MSLLLFLLELLHLFTLLSGLLMASILQQLGRYDSRYKLLNIYFSVVRFAYNVCSLTSVCTCRMTVYLRCGIPPRAGDLQWSSTTPPIKSLLLSTSPLFTWRILARSLVCPGGRPASSCPSKKRHAHAHTHSHCQGGQQLLLIQACCHSFDLKRRWFALWVKS